MTSWYEEWFNDDYLTLYSHRTLAQAESQVESLISLLKLSGSETVLDLGCGTGRHMQAFAERGYAIEGVDLSTTLLEKAREELDAPLHNKDMRHLQGLGPYDVICSFFTSFGYFDSKAEDQKVLFSVSNALKPGATFVLDTLHPTAVRQGLVAKSEETAGGRPVLITRTIEKGQVIKTICFAHKEYCERVTLYERWEVEEMLKRAGMRVVGVYNDFDGSPWSEKGERQIFVARKE